MESLRALVRSFPSVLLGYSGGVDSALLAVVLRQELGKSRMVAAIGRSASYPAAQWQTDRKSTRLNSSHSQISYAVFCLKKKNRQTIADSPRRDRMPVTRSCALHDTCR